MCRTVVNACVGSVNREATDELCECLSTALNVAEPNHFRHSGWIHDSALFAMLLL